MTLPLFDPAASTPAAVPPRDDVQRRITHCSGLFREVIDGATTGREYAIVELIDGRLMKQFADGRREGLKLRPDFIAYQVQIGVFVEERP